ncbi:LacI family transcriptional regulator [Labrys miyagiensis]|uniref:LacI family transcriptional regulator n=1 Tax=Labrys miyagiensis TaxID=346912 RepID=A0ABQ6CKD1_9HYPH|nr:LacI family DNA-binding transcriptional regulator [Labrys miyagiensis]GLS20209.1 LacI family transcriptional regulator [Labrys miyagiensis]
MALEAGHGKRASIADVARLAGVSLATVSNVVNGIGRVAPETREKVSAAVEALGYRPNGIAASLRNRRSRLIGMVVPAVTNALFAEMVHEFETLATADGYGITLVTSDEDPEHERERILALLSRQIDGLIILPAADDSLGAGLDPIALPPTVVLDRGLGLSAFDTVGLDNVAGGYAAARHLIELGHTAIAVVAPALRLASMRDRIAGVEQAMAEAGRQGRARVLLGGETMEGLRRATEQELRRPDRATAVFTTSNVATLGAIKAIHALELSMPRDVSLVGFDDYDWMTALRPYVSAVGQPIGSMAAKAWNILLRRLDAGNDTTPAEREHTQMEGLLRVRESTGRPTNRIARKPVVSR